MGKLKVIKAGALSTIQDKGRFGHRQYGIPQSGVMDVEAMMSANYLVSNNSDCPVVETAIQGLELEAQEETIVGITGATVDVKINDVTAAMNNSHLLKPSDILTISKPLKGVYSYLGIGGKLTGNVDFGSISTYVMAGFGGIDGRALKKGDVLETRDASPHQNRSVDRPVQSEEVQTIRMMKGPEWRFLKDLPERKTFRIDPSSNRMGIRLQGDPLGVDGKEIISSAVIPGTIQLPSNGLPIILMNDCQTTGGYPRIGKVIDKDLGLLAQLSAGSKVHFTLIDYALPTP